MYSQSSWDWIYCRMRKCWSWYWSTDSYEWRWPWVCPCIILLALLLSYSASSGSLALSERSKTTNLGLVEYYNFGVGPRYWCSGFNLYSDSWWWDPKFSKLLLCMPNAKMVVDDDFSCWEELLNQKQLYQEESGRDGGRGWYWGLCG